MFLFVSKKNIFIEEQHYRAVIKESTFEISREYLSTSETRFLAPKYINSKDPILRETMFHKSEISKTIFPKKTLVKQICSDEVIQMIYIYLLEYVYL